MKRSLDHANDKAASSVRKIGELYDKIGELYEICSSSSKSISSVEAKFSESNSSSNPLNDKLLEELLKSKNCEINFAHEIIRKKEQEEVSIFLYFF